MTRPMIVPLYTKGGEYIDDIVECARCGAFICYLTEYDVKNEYKYCRKCGEWIDWESVEKWETPETKPEHKTYVEGLIIGKGAKRTAELWHEVINGKSIYYDEKGFQVNPKLWRPL